MRVIRTSLSPCTILSALSAEILLYNDLAQDKKITQDQFKNFTEYAKVVRKVAECPRPVYGLASRAVLAGVDAVGSIGQYMADIDAINKANPNSTWYNDRLEEANRGLSDNPHLWREEHPVAALMLAAAEKAAAETEIDGYAATIHPALRHPAWVPGWHESIQELYWYCCNHVTNGTPLHSARMLRDWIERVGYWFDKYGPLTPHEAEINKHWKDVHNVDLLGYNSPYVDMGVIANANTKGQE